MTKDDKSKQEILNRLSYIQGHCGAVKNMVGADRYCIDVIHQIEAVEAGLQKAKEKILENHLTTCVTTAIKGQSEKERQRVIRELLAVYKKIC